MADLFLRVKREYFEQMRDGSRTHEFLLCTPYWRKRLTGTRGFARRFDRVIVTLGHPRGDDSRILIRPWRGYEIQTITHEHFGPDPVEVFAIRVN